MNWLDKYKDGGEFLGTTNKGFDYNGAWGGQFQIGGSIPGSVGFTYARTNNPAPSNGSYAKKTKASAQKGKAIPKFNLDNFKKKQEINLREKPREIVRDNTRVVFRDEKGKQKEVNPNLQIKTKHNAEKIKQQEIADRKARIADSMAAQKESYTTDNWRDLLARETQAIGDKLRISEEPNLFDDYLNPAVMVGSMASNLGQAPLQAQQSDSYIPYVTSIGTPLVTGAIGGVGAPTTKQFVNNLANPLAGTGEIVDKLGNRYLPNAYKYNPWAFKPNESNYYRQVSKEAIDDALSSKLIREKGEVVSTENYAKFQDQLEDLAGTKEYLNHEDKYRAMYNNNHGPMPYFQKGELFYKDKPTLTIREKGVPIKERKKVNLDHLIESNYSPENFQNSYGYKMSLGNPEEVGSVGILKPNPELRNLENFNIYKKDWLQGYKKVPKKEDGGIIKDDRGQWAHPGEITEINSNDITMQGVPYPVLGISDTGDTKLMQPGKDYKFKGKKVTEYPLAKNGKELVKLNQLTNFTNYNTKQSGGWLDKYSK